MDGIFKAICISDEETSYTAFQVLAEVPLIANLHISGYLERIGELTVQTMQGENINCIKQIF